MLFTVTNDNAYYVDLTKTLLQSLRDNSPKDEIRVYLINCTEEMRERFSCINSASTVINQSLELPDNPDEAKAIIAHYRTIIIKECLLNEDIDQLGWLDSDIMVRKSLDKFWEKTKQNTLQIMLREKNPEHGKFQVGVFSIGKSPEIIDLILEWDNATRNDNTFWYSEQKQLYLSYLKFRDYINFVNMDPGFNDHYGGKDSTIWHCKLTYFNKRYWQKEYHHYLRRANEKYNK